MIPVLTTSTRYAAAVAELPRSARHADGAAGAVVVVDSPDWVQTSLGALAAGASALVVPHPRHVSTDDIAKIAQAADGRPIVLERPGVAPDLLSAAPPSVAPAAFVAECAAPALDGGRAFRDAVRWLFLLTGGDLVVHESTSGRHGCLAALSATMNGGERSASIPGSIILTVREAGPVIIRATLLARRRIDVLSEGGHVTVTRVDEGDSVTPAQHFEGTARADLRRVFAALGGAPCEDLVELHRDAAVEEAVVADEGSRDSIL